MEHQSIRQEKLEAIDTLKKHQHYNVATTVMWSYIREIIFELLLRKEIKFNSTEQAIIGIFKIIDKHDVKQAIYFLYTISTMADWDESFVINKNDFALIKDKFGVTSNYINLMLNERK